jgi:hypothetical protein
MFNYPVNNNPYFSAIQSAKMPIKNPSTNTDGTKDSSSQPVKKKVQRGPIADNKNPESSKTECF